MEEPHSRYRRLVCRPIKVFAVAASEVTFEKRNFRDFYDFHSLGNLPNIFPNKAFTLRVLLAAACCRGITIKATQFYDARHMRTRSRRGCSCIFSAINPSASRHDAPLARCVYGPFPEAADERYIKKGYLRGARVGCKVETFCALISHTLPWLAFLVASADAAHP